MDNQEAIKRFRKRRSERMKIKPTRLDSVEAYRRRRSERLSSRMDDGEEGRWVTTENNHKVHISEEGVPDKGNKHVLAEMNKNGRNVTDTGASRAEVKRLRDELDNYQNKWKEESKNAGLADRRKKRVTGKRAAEQFEGAKSVYNGESLEEMRELAAKAGANITDGKSFQTYENYVVATSYMELFGEDALSKDFNTIVSEASSGYTDAKEKRRIKDELMGKMSQAAKSAFPKLTDCSDNFELELRMNSGDLFRADDINHFSLDGISDETGKHVGTAVQKMMDKYPALIGKLGCFTAGAMETNAFAASFGTDTLEGSQVVLNTRYFGQPEKMNERLKASVERKFHPEGTGTIAGVVTHEYGHQIDDYLTSCFKEQLGGKTMSQHVLARISQETGKSEAEVLRSVSEYSENNNAERGVEFFAEAFSEYMCSPSPRSTAVAVGKIIEEFIGRM